MAAYRPPDPQRLSASPAATPDHALALKVMRLSKPRLYHSCPVVAEDFSAAHEACGLSESLMLPQVPTNIYLGETFSSYISVVNQAPYVVTQVFIKIELHTGTQQRYVLLDGSSTPIARFELGGNYDTIVQGEIKELGSHILICVVWYTDVDGKQRSLRKFFKFQVFEPMAVQTRTYALQDLSFVEVQLQNASQIPMCLEEVKFDVASPFTACNLEDIELSAAHNGMAVTEPESISMHSFLKPGEIRQFVYQITDPCQHDAALAVVRSNSFGRVAIRWRTAFGEIGRCFSPPIPCRPFVAAEVEVVLCDVPDVVHLQVPFQLKCRVLNRTEKHLRLALRLQNDRAAGVLLNGKSGQVLGDLAPQQTREFPLQLFPVMLGIHRISGVCVLDLVSGRSWRPEQIVDVVVCTTTADDTVADF